MSPAERSGRPGDPDHHRSAFLTGRRSGRFLLTALAPERTIVMGPRPSGDRLNLLEESL
jgi:hypothetical protein